jgi:hypothetical protein
MIKSNKIKWAGHVARIGRREVHIGRWWESQKERDHLEDLDVCGRITKSILKGSDGVVWIGLIRLRIRTDGGLL